MEWNEIKPEIPIGILVGMIAGLWKITTDGTSWEVLGVFIIVATVVEWLGSIFFRRTHELTQEDIYKQMLMLREKIRRFDDDDEQ